MTPNTIEFSSNDSTWYMKEISRMDKLIELELKEKLA